MRSLVEYLLDELAYSKIFEQAMQRKKLRDRIYDHTTQILQNWALLIYFKETDNQNINHWKEELITQLNTILENDLKCNNRGKIALYKDCFLKDMDLDKQNNVYKRIAKKFNKEGIFDKKDIEGIASYIANNIEVLIKVLCDEDVYEWVDTL